MFRLTRVPLVYYSLEILSAKEIGGGHHENIKRQEANIHRKAAYTIIQDEERAFLQGISNSFTNIRANGSLISSDTDYNWSNWRIPFRLLKRLIRKTLRSYSPKPFDPYQQIKDRVRASLREGYKYHQQEVRNDNKLLEWVLRPNYWDAPIPQKKSIKP